MAYKCGTKGNTYSNCCYSPTIIINWPIVVMRFTLLVQLHSLLHQLPLFVCTFFLQTWTAGFYSTFDATLSFILGRFFVQFNLLSFNSPSVNFSFQLHFRVTIGATSLCVLAYTRHLAKGSNVAFLLFYFLFFLFRLLPLSSVCTCETCFSEGKVFFYYFFPYSLHMNFLFLPPFVLSLLSSLFSHSSHSNISVFAWERELKWIQAKATVTRFCLWTKFKEPFSFLLLPPFYCYSLISLVPASHGSPGEKNCYGQITHLEECKFEIDQTSPLASRLLLVKSVSKCPRCTVGKCSCGGPSVVAFLEHHQYK